MKDFSIHLYEDNGLWSAEGADSQVRGFTTALGALEAWKLKLVDLTLTDAIIRQHANPASPIDLARVDAFRTEIDDLKLALAAEKEKKDGLIAAIKKLKESSKDERPTA